jgi:hypothetical protein
MPIINYEQELLDMITNNSIKTLPSQGLINTNREIAKAVWHSYVPPGALGYDDCLLFDKWYGLCDWKNVLVRYKDDIGFWESSFSDFKAAATMLLYEPFKKDFPLVAKHYLTNNGLLKKLLFASNNEEFFELIQLPANEKEELYFEYQMGKSGSIDEKFIPKYENDPVFVTKLLEKSPMYFQYLNEENRNNFEFIKLALKKRNNGSDRSSMENLFHLNQENRDKYFSAWLKPYGNAIRAKDLDKYTTIEQTLILTNHPDLLRVMLEKNFNRFKYLGLKLLNENFDSYLPCFNVKQLELAFKNESDLTSVQLEKITHFVLNYNTIKKPTLVEKNYLYLTSIVLNLKDRLESDLLYKIDCIAQESKKVDLEGFLNFVDDTISQYQTGRIKEEQAEKIINALKSIVPNELKQELKLPKNNTFKYLQMEKLNHELSTSLPVNDIKIVKNKI